MTVHMMSIVISDVDLRVRAGTEEGDNLKAIGVAQGDFLGTILFMLSLGYIPISATTCGNVQSLKTVHIIPFKDTLAIKYMAGTHFRL